MTFERKIVLTDPQRKAIQDFVDRIVDSRTKLKKSREEIARFNEVNASLSEKYRELEGKIRFDDLKGVQQLTQMRVQLDVLGRNLVSEEHRLTEAISALPPLGRITEIIREICYPDYEVLLQEVAADLLRYYLRDDLALQAAKTCELTRLYIQVISQDFGGILNRETAAQAALLPLNALLSGVSPFRLKD